MPTGPALINTQGSTRDAIRNFFATEARNAEKLQRHVLGLSEDDELPPYVHQEYPKAMHAIDGETALVHNPAEERAQLNEGFFSTLAEAKAAAEEGAAIEDEEPEDAADLGLHEQPTVLRAYPAKKLARRQRRKAD